MLKIHHPGPDDATFRYWFHFSNGSLRPVMGRLMVVSRVGHPVQLSVQARLDRLMALVEARLGGAPYLAGQEFMAADFMSVFSFATMRHFQPVDLAPYPNIRA